jgi:hypothetical protein
MACSALGSDRARRVLTWLFLITKSDASSSPDSLPATRQAGVDEGLLPEVA